MAAQGSLQKGHQWEVGNGESMGIWRDKWLHQPSTFRITKTSPVFIAQEKVSLLIDPQIGNWLVYMVRQIFSTDDANAMLSIPLSPQLPTYKLVWAYTYKGEFTLRSAYKISMTSSNNPVRGAPSDC